MSRAGMTVPDEAFAQAAAWYARLAAEDATPADRAAFAAWRRADPAHAVAWGEISRLDVALVPRAVPKPPAAPRRRALALGGAAAAAAIAGAVFLPGRIDRLTSDLATAVGERTTLRLAGGAEVALNTDTALDVTGAGSVSLRRGEALLSVPAGAAPLTATAGSATVTAAGATFGLRQDGDAVLLTVLEGEVEPVPVGPAVTADMQVLLGAGRPVEPVPVIADHVLAWRRGQIVVVQAPLAALVAEVRRHLSRFVLLDPRVAERPVTAVLDLDRLDSALDALAQSMGLAVTRLPPFLLALRASF